MIKPNKVINHELEHELTLVEVLLLLFNGTISFYKFL